MFFGVGTLFGCFFQETTGQIENLFECPLKKDMPENERVTGTSVPWLVGNLELVPLWAWGKSGLVPAVCGRNFELVPPRTQMDRGLLV